MKLMLWLNSREASKQVEHKINRDKRFGTCLKTFKWDWGNLFVYLTFCFNFLERLKKFFQNGDDSWRGDHIRLFIYSWLFSILRFPTLLCLHICVFHLLCKPIEPNQWALHVRSLLEYVIFISFKIVVISI